MTGDVLPGGRERHVRHSMHAPSTCATNCSGMKRCGAHSVQVHG